MITVLVAEMVGTWAFWGVYSIVGPKLISEKAAEKNALLKTAKALNDMTAAVMGLCFISPIYCVKEVYEKANERFGSF